PSTASSSSNPTSRTSSRRRRTIGKALPPSSASAPPCSRAAETGPGNFQGDSMLRRSLILSMALGGLVATAPMGAAHAQTTTIKASIWVSPKHPSGDRGYGAFMKYVEEQSKGSIKFRYWSGGSLLGARDTLPGLINGIAHVSSMAMTYFPAEFPYAQL